MRILYIFIHFIFLIGSTWASDLSSNCPNIKLPPSQLIQERQPDAGMCYAYRDTKTMQYLLDDLGDNTSTPSLSVLDSAVQSHRHFLRVKQLLAKYTGQDYNKGGTILDAGENCQVVNELLKNGLCKNKIITSKTFDQIYNFTIGLEKNFFYINNESCNENDSLKEFKLQMSQLFQSTLLATLATEERLSLKERKVLKSLIFDITRTDKKMNYPKMVKKLERMARRKCAPINRKKLKALEKYHCKNYFFPALSSSKNYSQDNKKVLLQELQRMQNTPIMVGLCSSKIYSSGTKRPADMSFNETVGSLNCGPHALILSGSRNHHGKCQVLMEDNYGYCEKRPWTECEKDNKDQNTGRFWVDVDDLSPTLIGISVIEKTTK